MSSDERGWKITKSFRLSPEVIDALERGSEETKLSQGELIEQCVIRNIEAVLQERRVRREMLKETSALAEGVTQEAPSKPSAGLTKRQQQ